MQETIENIKKKYPDEWLILGNPVMSADGQRMLSAILLYHGADKRQLAEMNKPLLKQYKSTAVLYNKTTFRNKHVLAGGRNISPIKPVEKPADEILI